MENLKEKIHRTMEDKAIKKALDEELNIIGSYEIDENSKVICKIDKLKLIKMFKNKDEYRLNLPITFLLNLQATFNYKNCDKKIIDIEYIIEDCIFDKQFIIDSYSNVLFKGCYFSKGLTIKRGRNIKLTGNLVVSSGLSINAQQLDFYDSFVMYHTKTNNIGKLNVKTTNVDGLSLLSLDERININSDVIIIDYNIKLTGDNINDIIPVDTDYIIDACDDITAKIEIIKYAIKNNIKIISSMGTANKMDPSKLEITNIWMTNYDPLAKKIRSILRKEGINYKLPVVSSKEETIKNGSLLGSYAPVCNTAGILLACYVLNDIIKSKD